MKHLERQRSEAALDWVLGWEKSKKLDDAATRLKGLPIMLRSQGLIATCATLLKSDKAWDKDVVVALARWLAGSRGSGSDALTSESGGEDLLKVAVSLDNAHYRRLQREAIAYAEHLKLLAEAWANGQQN